MKQELEQNKWHKRNRRKQSVLEVSITNVCEHFADVSFFYLSHLLWVLFTLFTSWEVPGAITIIWIILQRDSSGVYVSVRVISAWQMISWHSVICWAKSVFSGPTGGWKTSCQMYKTILWAPSLFPTLPVQQIQEFFLTTITSWVCCTGRVGKELEQNKWHKRNRRKQYVHIVLYIRQPANLCVQINYNDHSVDMKKIFLKRIWWCRKTWTWAGITTPKPKAAQCWKHIREIHHRHVTFVCGRTAEMKCRFNVGCSFLTHESTWCTRMNDYSLTSIKSQLTMCTISRANIIWNFTSAR